MYVYAWLQITSPTQQIRNNKGLNADFQIQWDTDQLNRIEIE